MKRNVIIGIIVIISILILATIVAYTILADEENEGKKIISVNNDTVIPQDKSAFTFNNETNEYIIIIGPVIDEDGIPMEKVKVSIKFENLSFDNLTDEFGHSKIIIPSDDCNVSKYKESSITIILEKEGYETEEIAFVMNEDYCDF